MNNRVTILSLVFLWALSAALSANAEESSPYTVEHYYKIKWGYFAEFLELYKKNHYPILKALQDQGHILSMTAHYPINHAGESDRWDMRVTIVFKDTQTTAVDRDNEIIAELYPDTAKFQEEEQRRFEMIISHRDVPIRAYDLADWGEATRGN